MSVLILAADQKQALPVVQSLGKKGIRVTCLSSKSTAPAFYSKYCFEKIHFEKTSDEDKYVDFLKSLVKKGQYKLLIPCSDYSTVLISAHRAEIFPFTKAFLPSHNLVKTVTSKSSLMKIAEILQISVPKTLYPKNSTDLEKLASGIAFPTVIKGDITAGAKKVKYAKSESDLYQKYEEIRRTDEAPIIQEYIDGRDYLFYALCDKGDVIAYYMMGADRSYPPTGGTPAKAHSVFDTDLKDFSFDILKKTEWTGMVGLDIKQDLSTKQYRLLDFNPRFGATTSLAVKSGVDFPYCLYRLAVEGKKEYMHDYAKVTYRSLFREDMFYAVKKPLSLPKLLIEFFDPRVYYGFDRDDPRPFFRMAKNTFNDLKRSIFR